MAVKVHGRKTSVYIGGYDLSDIFTSADASETVDSSEVTGFTAQDKEFIAGMRNGTMRFQGWFSKDAASSDPVLSALPGDDSVVVTLIRDTDAFEGPAEAQEGPITSYSRSSPIGGVVSVAADFQASGGLAHTRTLKAKGSLTPSVAGGTTAAYNGGTTTTHGAVGFLQIFSASGTPVVAIDHSNNGSTGWAAVITFAGLTAAGAERVAVSTDIKPYLRTTVTGGTAVCWVGISQPIY